MRTRLLTIGALAISGALTLNAQQPQRPPDPQGDTTQRAAEAAKAQVVTVTGCLKAEKDVPGRRPNAPETAAAGATEKFVLTNVKMAPATTTSAIGLAPTYGIAGIADAELQKHLNHEVQIVGTVSPGDARGNRGAAAAPGSAASANANLPQLQGTTLTMLSATCPVAQ